MPTSSQALLLMNTGRSNLTLDKIQVVAKKSSIGTCTQRELTPCPVSHVDINELWKSSIVDNGEQLIVEDLTNLEDEKDSSIVKSEFNIKGYKTFLSYNKSSGSFSWKFHQPEQTESSAETQESETTVLPPPLRTRPKTGVGTERTRHRKSIVQPRPKTADEADPKRQSVTFAKPLHYSCSNKGDKLVCFGLRVPSTNETPEETTDCASLHKTAMSPHKRAWSNPSAIGSRGLESGGNGAVNVKMKEFKGNTRPPCSGAASGGTRAMLTRIWKEFDKQRQMASIKKSKDEKIENDSYATSFANRVHPSIYMRKDPPDAGPYDVCFSLRDNEAVSHEELRDTIRRQTGVVPVYMQYEALSIRVGDYGIRNRWIVKTRSQEDFNQLIESGLFIDNDDIVVMSLVEVMEREFRTHQFLTQTKAEHVAAGIGSKLRKNTIQNKI